MRSWPASSTRPGPWGAFRLLGPVHQGVAVLFFLFALLALVLGEDARGFALGALLAFLTGRLFQGQGLSPQPKRAEVFAAVALLWLSVPLLGALPYWVSGGLGFLDAFFESMSGFTTTGATVLTDLARVDRTLLLWRSFSQWVGGVGIVVLFLVILPQLQVAGRQAFFAETTGVEKERLTPRLRQTARAALWAYLLLTGLAFLGYFLGGLSPYEALATAWSTVSAGGFSPHPMGFAAYSPVVQWLGVFFMFWAGVNFLLQYRLFFAREPRALFQDPEFRAYALVVGLSSLALAAYLYTHGLYGLEASLRHALFQAVSILTTTGYASADFALWPVPAQAILVLLMFLGASAGSAAGGIKLVRWLLLLGFLRREVTRALHPQAVLPLRLGSRVVGEEALRQVSVFVFLYTLIFTLGALLLALWEQDFVVAFTASAQALGNIGPGLGAVGPMASYAHLAPLSKLVLILQMWAGRIEILPVVLLLAPELWRRLR
ncbi:TrkH family potassium uptake protein [Thermus islandicus]|uniref:TrkH family potassium uptake protein n=1 Tax=Thermus islandicus TaxID=540988 RepID=UPI0003B6A049|nr:TrkH family potassium uptake protein [Thermus islandicus]